jgi:hypothetical protein
MKNNIDTNQWHTANEKQQSYYNENNEIQKWKNKQSYNNRTTMKKQWNSPMEHENDTQQWETTLKHNHEDNNRTKM